MTTDISKALKELISFLQLGSRTDLKTYAIHEVIALTGTEDGIKCICDYKEFLVLLIALLSDNNEPVCKDAALSLINISANAYGARTLMHLEINSSNAPPLQKPPEDVVTTSLAIILDPNSSIADPCCMILSNLSRPAEFVDKVIDIIEKSQVPIDQLITVFSKKGYNKNGAKLYYLGPVLSNLSQSSRIRKYILDKNKCVIQRLLPFTEYKDSTILRGGVVGTLRNCCFEEDSIPWMLSEEVDILPRFLLPLAGSEEFDEEDNEKLPLELQYLPEDKLRDEDPDIRCMLLEALLQLCATKESREYLRAKNAYIILREFHKWEKDHTALAACENIVDVLIRTEDEIGEDNLKQLDIPEDLTEKFHKLNADTLENK